MPTLWGRPNSINVQKVSWLLAELGLPHEFALAGMEHGVVDTPVFRALNPNGFVPVWQDGAFVLFESNAIVRHLAAAHPERGFWPADPAVRAIADQWMDWQQTTFYPAIAPAFMQLVRTPAARRDAAVVEASLLAGEAVAARLEAALEGREWLAGEGIGVAELALGPSVHRWLSLPLDRAPRPNLERWHAALRARPAGAATLVLPLT